MFFGDLIRLVPLGSWEIFFTESFLLIRVRLFFTVSPLHIQVRLFFTVSPLHIQVRLFFTVSSLHIHCDPIGIRTCTHTTGMQQLTPLSYTVVSNILKIETFIYIGVTHRVNDLILDFQISIARHVIE